MSRVAVVASHPIQYQAPWFRALARAVDLVVFFCHRQDAQGQADAGFGEGFEWDVDLLDGYEARWLTNRAARPGVETFSGCDTPEIRRRLSEEHFDACIVSGWYLRSYIQAIRACWSLGVPVLVRGDSQLKGPRRIGVAAAKYLPYRWFLRRVDGHLYVGKANYDYLRHYGVESDRLFFAPHFVDNAWFRDQAARACDDGSADAIRLGERSPDGRTTVLFAGKFIEKKRPRDFVEAVGVLAQSGVPIQGLLVGAGPLGGELESLAADSGAPVRFLGFRNQTDMPACYAAADCLVLPSDGRETWGLVVNEAMACGLPVITSDAVGAARDLIEEGETGYVFPAGDVGALAEAMRTMTGALEDRGDHMRAAVRSRIDAYSCEAAVAGTLDALKRTTRQRPSAAGPVVA
jgi:glycosyltransferase involved in cell wall biosynthesis